MIEAEKTRLDNQLLEVLTQTKKIPAITSADVHASLEQGFSASVRQGEVENLSHHRGQNIVLTVYVGQKTGSASTTDLSFEAIVTMVQKAYQIAQLAADDPCAGLADAALMAKDWPDLDLYHPWDLTPQAAIELAKTCEAHAFAQDKRICNSEGVTVDNYTRLRAYANTHGFLGSYPSSRHSMSCLLLAQAQGADKNAPMERDYAYTTARDPSDLRAAEWVAEAAASRTVQRLGAQRIKTQQLPVILTPELTRGLFGQLIAAVSGSKLYRKASFLLDHLGQAILPEAISVEERPHEPKALGSAPFDSEGVATQARPIVTDGVLQRYVLGSYSARKLGMETTANAGGTHNVYVTSREPQLSETALLKTLDTGILVTELIGQGVNLVTGDYSRGAFGYWVENGIIQYPVSEFTIASNLKSLFRNIRALGNDIDHRGNICVGSALIDNLTIAGD